MRIWQSRACLLLLGVFTLLHWAFAQSINSGTVQGTVKDQSGAVVPNAAVQIRNSVTGYQQSAQADQNGAYRLSNIPPNNYSLTASAAGFSTVRQQIVVHSGVPLQLNLTFAISAETQSVEVEASENVVESDPSAHQDVDRVSFSKLPTFNPGAGLSDAITYSTGGVTADANGFFHPVGDHAQVSFVIDGQPISDQQSKIFSTQLPVNAVQSMELITGFADAQYGDKSSLVVNATTRSGLGVPKAFGNISSNWGSFGTWGGDASLGFGGPKYGNFLSVSGTRTGRFLDTPELLPIHDIGQNETIFDRFDYQPSGKDAFHLNLYTARNWFQVPNSYDQLTQDQRQRVLTYNIAPGYQHTFSGRTLLTVNPFLRRDQVNYYGSRNPFSDTPATASQDRFLTNLGAKADLSYLRGHHDLKFGVQIQQTRLDEHFSFGITDPSYNPVCLDGSGNALALPSITDPARCSRVNPAYGANPDLQPGLLPYDLSRGGSLFIFRGKHNINQYAFYVTDTIKLGNLTINAGLRDDQYNGLSSANGVQPRVGLAYLMKKTGTVVRASYARTFETPFNENLILASGTGAGGLANNVFGANSEPIRPGNRNQFNAGMQQKITKYVLVDADYFWKFTHNGYDFDALFNTPLTFPISWHNSKIDGVTARISTVDLHGFQAYMTLGHTRARYFPPETGGLVAQSSFSDAVFRIDHDQAYQQSVVLRYQRPHNGEWIDFTWRYDSGMVNGSVTDVADALALTAAQQAAIGFYCGGFQATVLSPITAAQCNPSNPPTHGATRVRIPAEGTENADTNPPRIAPRNLLNIALGTDNLLHHEKGGRITARFSIENLTNKDALYNFLSTFSGTHFIAPRTFQIALGYAF